MSNIVRENVDIVEFGVPLSIRGNYDTHRMKYEIDFIAAGDGIDDIATLLLCWSPTRYEELAEKCAAKLHMEHSAKAIEIERRVAA